jgi:hypothetical protein
VSAPRYPYRALIFNVPHYFIEMHGPELANIELDVLEHLAELRLHV